MKTYATLLDEVKDELGTDLTSLFSDIDNLIARWLNRGQDLLDYQIRRKDTITWSAEDTEIALPADYARGFKFLPDASSSDLPPGHEIEGEFVITRPEGAVADGSGRIVYWAYPQTITSSSPAGDSELPKTGDNAIVAYARYAFFNRLATSRADYERYSTMLGQNGVDMAELAALAAEYYNLFLAYKNELPRKPSVAAY